jgi:putative SOS response-associated peptidase YedK
MNLINYVKYTAERARYWNSVNQQKDIYFLNAFTKPQYPVVIVEDKPMITLLQWGIIPYWCKDIDQANMISKGTYNAVGETIFEKPSFRQPVMKRRCLVPVSGFFEWQHYGGKTYPYYIRLKDREHFSFAGIWESWKNPAAEEITRTFSIITTQANPLMEKIHNTKKRMPVILRFEDEDRWLNSELTDDGINDLLKPFAESEMEAYTVSNFITKRGVEHNVPEAVEKFNYEELPEN